ncbi:hypothetical protein [Acidaminococcus timonensis]|jgi:hypothetical protein|uniref:hypothetical protein n=1 Tax=Acidaminococcus timonensis TaxID=1871002 RepID=UPI003A5BEC80
MAYRRMLLKELIRNDHFLTLPHSSQCLYMHLLLEADDDGFVSNPLSVVRMTRTTVEDLKNLLNVEYILVFSSGVILIKNWCQHNKIRRDRYRSSILTERQYITKLEDGTYKVLENCKCYCNQLATTCQTDGCQPDNLFDANLDDSWVPNG